MYRPQRTLLAAVKSAFPLQMFPWDDYFPTMAEADLLTGRADVLAAKSYFIRQAPFGGSYALLGGVTEMLRTMSELDFTHPDLIAGMRDMHYRPEFISWLQQQERLRLQVYAPPEGSVFFPNEPIVTVRAPLPHLRLAEGVLTEALNFPTLSLTKWYRMRRTVRPGHVLEFGRRRSQNALRSSFYGILGGCYATSNDELRRHADVLVQGTMGHEWMQGYGDVRAAFHAWLTVKPEKPVGLVDTMQCLEHDFPVWLDEVWEHREAIKSANPAIWGWRNDSGDLAYLTIEQYVRFLKHPLAQDPWFVERMRIVLTNELDEYAAQAIIAQIRTQAGAAGLDAEDILRRIIWAAGTKPSTCWDQPAIGGVAKLMMVDGKACIKLAFDAEGLPGLKTSIPHFNRSAVIRNGSGEVKTVLLYPADTFSDTLSDGHFVNAHNEVVRDLQLCHPENPAAQMRLTDYTASIQQHLVFDTLQGGGFTTAWQDVNIADVAARIQRGVDSLHWSMTRLDKPYPVKVSLTPALFALRRRMIEQRVLREDLLMADV